MAYSLTPFQQAAKDRLLADGWRFHQWTPDTHPDYTFEIGLDPNDPNPNDPWCHIFAAWYEGTPIEHNLVQIHQTIMDENRLKNRALAFLETVLPARMFKDEVDQDGDPTGRRVLKAKHSPEWFYGDADNILNVSVPGLLFEEVSSVRRVLAEKYGNTVLLDF